MGISTVMGQIMALAERHGCTVDRVTRNKHYKVYAVAPDGRKGVMVYPVSPSDHRTAKNQETQWRHFATGRQSG